VRDRDEHRRRVLILSVSNTIAPANRPARGIGLNNVRERLAVQFEGRARLGGLRQGMGQRNHDAADARPSIAACAAPLRVPGGA
jgi:hypothetical protein